VDLPAAQRIQIALLTLAAPAITEELLFRSWIPNREEEPSLAAAVLPSAISFAVWHLLEAYTFLSAHRSLLARPDFLALAFLLGLLCAVLRRRSDSLWTAVALHWVVVAAWSGWLGGPHSSA
jgi:predicted Abi (CAAX) family protease